MRQLLLVCFLFLGVFSNSLIHADGYAPQYWPAETELVNDANKRPQSSYQRLKTKYEKEAAYSDELKGRILVLQDANSDLRNEAVVKTEDDLIGDHILCIFAVVVALLI